MELTTLPAKYRRPLVWLSMIMMITALIVAFTR
jgi:hypothetical protein